MAQNDSYSDEFYAKFIAGSLRSARAVLPEVFTIVAPRSIADVGCGLGAWLHVARELGITRVTGFDGSHVNRAALLIDPEDFVACELESERLPYSVCDGRERFGLTLCLEVAEHLPAESAGFLVKALTRLSDVVLFSAAIPFQGGVNHVNEQWPEYWALLFEAHRYICCDCLRERFWTDPAVEWWYAQNILLFVHEDWAAARRDAPTLAEGRPPLSRVHPLNYICRATRDPYPHVHDFGALASRWSTHTRRYAPRPPVNDPHRKSE
jgi:SAM-dependent methyltransferase